MNADKKNQTNSRIPEDPLDDLFRQSLGNQASEPDPATWNRIRRDLLWSELLRFRLVNVPWYALVMVPLLFISLSIGGYFLFQQEDLVTKPGLPHQQSVAEEKTVPLDEVKSGLLKNELEKSGTRIRLASPVLVNQVPASVTPLGKEPEPLQRLYLASVTMASLPAGLFTFRDPLSATNFQSIEQGSRPVSSDFADIPEPPVIKMETETSYDMGVNISPDMVFYKNSSNYYKYNYTLDFGGQFTRGRFYMQSGIGLTYSSDIGSYDISYKQNDSVGYYYSVVGIIVSAGKVVYSTNKVTVFDSVDYVYDYNTRNTYLYLQLPLKAGYNIISRPRFTLGVHGGGYYTMMVYKDEPDPEFYAPDSKVEEIERKDPERYTHSFGLTGGVKLEYKFSRHVFLMVEPNVKYSLNALDKDSGSGTQQPFSVGLRAGIWYRFGK